MRKLIVSNLISLDGFLAGPNDEIDWFTGIELIESVDTILFGRVTYQLMAGYWPTASATEDDPRIIEAMNDLPKVEWKNSRLVKTDAAEEVTRLGVGAHTEGADR